VAVNAGLVVETEAFVKIFAGGLARSRDTTSPLAYRMFHGGRQKPRRECIVRLRRRDVDDAGIGDSEGGEDHQDDGGEKA